MAAPLERWSEEHGRHTLPWRMERDRWRILLSEVLLQQTQAARVEEIWPTFRRKYGTPQALVDAGLGQLLQDWGRLGYPRRAKALWNTARILTEQGWPEDLETLPGIGPYTAAAIDIQFANAALIARDTNIARVLLRYRGTRTRSDQVLMKGLTPSMAARERFWAFMDLGSLVCTPKPACDSCPLFTRCGTRGIHSSERTRRVAPYSGSLREQRGNLLQQLRSGPLQLSECDPTALTSLLGEGLVIQEGSTIQLPD